MSSNSGTARGSYGYAKRAELPGQAGALDRAQTASPSFDQARCEYRARELADMGTTESQRRASLMVAQDRPHPAPRPSWAPEADRAAFDAAWDRERSEAETRQREARRAAFKAKRAQEQAQTRSLTFNRRAARQST